MQLQYAADNLTLIPAGHFLARKASDLATIKDQIKKDPAALVRNILEGFGGAATQTQISEMFLGDIFTEAEWKRWWDSTKKVLKKEGYFQIPAKKTEPITLRVEKISRGDELLAIFEHARQAKEQVAALDQIIRFHHEFEDPAKQLQPIVNAIEDSAARNERLNPALTFELVIARDDLLTRVPQLKTTNPNLTLTRLIADEETRLATILPKISSARERRVLQTLPAALGPRWTVRALLLMQESHARMVSQIPKVFIEAGQQIELRSALEQGIREHSATSETLFWLCKERDEFWSQLISPDLLAASLGALERDQHNENARGSRLRDILLDDRELIPEMFRNAEMDVARDSMRRLMLTPVFDDLTKRSLLARIIKLYPELGAMITGAQPEEKTEVLVVSWSSLHKRREEYEELIKKKIPENTKEIALARSYGDLSENFEFKAAKQMQAVLMRRKTELEQMLLNARGTAFQSPDTSRVSIGTIVTLRDADSKEEETYTILGAWDGDPERQIISYQTAIGQALIGHSLGEVVTLNTDHGTGRSAIISIEAAPVDEAAADPALAAVAIEEVAVE